MSLETQDQRDKFQKAINEIGNQIEILQHTLGLNKSEIDPELFNLQKAVVILAHAKSPNFTTSVWMTQIKQMEEKYS